MSLLNILYYPDKRLRRIADPVLSIDEKIIQIIDDMFDTMYHSEGIGLAATQVNIHKQIIVIDISKMSKEKLVFINPLITQKIGNNSVLEGCLSIPTQRCMVPRSAKIKVRATNTDGKKFEIEAEDLLAICIQHEMDHLIGKLFIDYLQTPQKYASYEK